MVTKLHKMNAPQTPSSKNLKFNTTVVAAGDVTILLMFCCCCAESVNAKTLTCLFLYSVEEKTIFTQD